MKITGTPYTNEALKVSSKNVVAKVRQNVRDEQPSEMKQSDKVTLGQSRRDEAANVWGYSPDSLKTDIASAPRAEKIARIKEDIDQGRYEVSSDKVAEKLVGSHIDELV